MKRPVLRNDRGASAAEYAILIGAIAAIIVGTVAALGIEVGALFTSVDF